MHFCVMADAAAVPRRLADGDGGAADETGDDEGQECSSGDKSECRDCLLYTSDAADE